MNSKLHTHWANFKAFSLRPITFLVCTPIIFILIGVFAYRFQPVDPDIWWHVHVGQSILKEGIQFNDVYSFTFSGYSWVDHEWLQNVLMFIAFDFSKSFFILAIVYVAITFISFFLQASGGVKQGQSDAGQVAIWLSLLLGLMACLSIVGIRALTPSLIGFSLIWGKIQNTKWHENKHVLWQLPLLFCLWANVHGGFVFGLVLLLLDLLCLNHYLPSLLEKRSRKLGELTSSTVFDLRATYKTKALILFLCFLSTLINPYGFTLYSEALNVFFDQYAHQWLREWRPPDFAESKYVYFLIYLFLQLALIIRDKYTNKKLGLSQLQIVSFLLFLFLSLRSVRHSPFFILVSLSTFAFNLEALFKSLPGLGVFKNNEQLCHAQSEQLDHVQNQEMKLSNLPHVTKQISLRNILSLTVLFFGFLSCLTSWYFGAKQLKSFFETNHMKYLQAYPFKALSYLKAHDTNLQINVLAEYGWGGFVSWYEPRVKVFIDGRMPSWKLNKNKYATSKGTNKHTKSEALIKEKKGLQLNLAHANYKTVLQLFNEVYVCNASSKELWQKYKVEYLLLSKEKYSLDKKCYKANAQLVYADEMSVLLKVG